MKDETIEEYLIKYFPYNYDMINAYIVSRIVLNKLAGNISWLELQHKAGKKPEEYLGKYDLYITALLVHLKEYLVKNGYKIYVAEKISFDKIYLDPSTLITNNYSFKFNPAEDKHVFCIHICVLKSTTGHIHTVAIDRIHIEKESW